MSHKTPQSPHPGNAVATAKPGESQGSQIGHFEARTGDGTAELVECEEVNVGGIIEHRWVDEVGVGGLHQQGPAGRQHATPFRQRRGHIVEMLDDMLKRDGVH